MRRRGRAAEHYVHRPTTSRKFNWEALGCDVLFLEVEVPIEDASEDKEMHAWEINIIHGLFDAFRKQIIIYR